MFIQALLVALSYYLAWLLDSIFGFQTATRPIILGTITGLLCGDLKTDHRLRDSVRQHAAGFNSD